MVGVVAVMAKQKPTNTGKSHRQRRTRAIQVEDELGRMVAVIASHRGISQSEFLSPFIRQFVTTEYRKTQIAMGKELDAESSSDCE